VDAYDNSTIGACNGVLREKLPIIRQYMVLATPTPCMLVLHVSFSY
jgi:hypothetical protein